MSFYFPKNEGGEVSKKPLPGKSLERAFVDDDAVVDLLKRPGDALEHDTAPSVVFMLMADPVTCAPDETVTYSARQVVFLVALLESNNPYLAARKAGVTDELAMQWFRESKFQAHMMEKRLQKAKSRAMKDTDVIDSIAYDVLINGKEIGRQTVKVWETIYKHLHGDKLSRALEQADEWRIEARKVGREESIVTETVPVEDASDGRPRPAQ